MIVGVGGAGWRFFTPSVTLKMNSASDIVEAGEGHEEGSNNRRSDGVLQSDLGRGKPEDMRIHDDAAMYEIGTESYHQDYNIQKNVETIENRTLEPEAIAAPSSPLRVQSLDSVVSSSFDMEVENKVESNHVTTSVAGQQPSPLEEQKTAPTPCQPQPPSSDQVVAHSFVYMMHYDGYATDMFQFFLLYCTGSCYHNCKIQASSINGKAKH